MATAKKIIVPSAEEVRIEALKTLIQRMGITKAAVFIRESLAQKTDYLEVKDRLFSGKTAIQCLEEMKKE